MKTTSEILNRYEQLREEYYQLRDAENDFVGNSLNFTSIEVIKKDPDFKKIHKAHLVVAKKLEKFTEKHLNILVEEI